LHMVPRQFLQDPAGIRMRPIIEGQKKAGLHNAFCFSSSVFSTLPVQV
jgi:hypothetical protein